MIKTMSDLPKTLTLAGVGLVLLFSAGARGALAPFVFGLLLARWADAPVTRLSRRLPRPLAAAVILSLAGLLLCDGALLLGVQLWRALSGAAGLRLEESLFPELSRLAQGLPGPLGAGAGWLVDQLRDQSGLLHTRAEARLADAAAAVAAALPRLLLSWGVALLCAFYACADWERVSRWLGELLPRPLRGRMKALGHRLAQGGLGWLRVQGRLYLLQAGLLWGGLALLGREHSLGLALLIAFADALPVLGSGTALLPWALGELAGGEWSLAGGLVLLWALSVLSRSVLEPRLLGRQTGRSPLLSLLALYAGLRLAGVGGMILAPIALNALCLGGRNET